MFTKSLQRYEKKLFLTKKRYYYCNYFQDYPYEMIFF